MYNKNGVWINSPENIEWIKKQEQIKATSPSTRHRRKQKKKLYTILGGSICVKCGMLDIRCLQINHKESSMKQDIKYMGSYKNVLKYYIDNPKMAKRCLQILCANCNWIKRYNDKGEYDP